MNTHATWVHRVSLHPFSIPVLVLSKCKYKVRVLLLKVIYNPFCVSGLSAPGCSL